MPKLRIMSGQQVRAILERHGFHLARQKESHMMMARRIVKEDGTVSTITVPVPDHREIAIGTLGNIIQLSGLARELFEV